MDAPNDELRSHGLFHRDHGQLLCGWGTHPRKAGGKPGDPLQAAGLPALTHHWGANDHHYAEHHS